MKKTIIILILTITASVLGQDNVHDKMLQAVAQSLDKNYTFSDKVPGAFRVPDKEKDKAEVRIESDIRPADTWAPQEVHIFAVHILIKKKESGQSIADTTRDKIVAAFKDFPQDKWSVTVTADIRSKRVVAIGDTPSYYVSPLHITTWCSAYFCSSTVYGGNVYETYPARAVYVETRIATAAAQNY